MMMMGNPNVFTAAQWEELEQQALIYKYMVSGVPVPTDLILSVRRSLYNSPSSSLSNQPTSLGVWEGSSFPYNQLYQIGGYGRKVDLEPGRCRRTDGKKWRCAKEAYPDSKYCERHMHRGRNRSRKPVEFSSSSSSPAITVSSSSSTVGSKSISNSDAYPSFNYSNQTLKDYRQLQGMKDLGEPSGYQNYSQFSFQNLKDEHQKKQEGQHCFVMGADFINPSEEAIKSSNTKVDEISTSKQQPFHHFFSQPKATMLNPNHEPNWGDHQSKATLSTQELFQSKPRPYW